MQDVAGQDVAARARPLSYAPSQQLQVSDALGCRETRRGRADATLVVELGSRLLCEVEQFHGGHWIFEII